MEQEPPPATVRDRMGLEWGLVVIMSFAKDVRDGDDNDDEEGLFDWSVERLFMVHNGR